MAALNMLETYGAISGLLVNTDKTQIVWIGKKRHSKEKIETGKNLIWGSSEFYLLGIHFSVSLDKLSQLNFDPIIIKIRELLEKWKKRLLTPLGRITVLKTLILPKFNHLFMSLPSPPEKTLKEINSLFLKFIWDNKPDRQINISQTLFEGWTKHGGPGKVYNSPKGQLDKKTLV